MSYQYPKHFKYPEGKDLYFKGHIESWDNFLKPLEDKQNICLEIGALYGGSSVYILDKFCNVEGSHHYIMDINKDGYLINNLKPYEDKVTYLIDESANSFKTFQHNGLNKEFLDFVYIDGNHMSKYVLEDAVNSFYCLKDDGIMVFDDFGGGWEQDKHMQVRTAVDSFIHSYEKYIEVLFVNYQVILKKKKYINEVELKENYYV